jgi:predicted RNase H-like HicB family nuclease
VNQLHAAYLRQDGKWWVACHPTIQGANGIGKTQEEALQCLQVTLDLILGSDRAFAVIGTRSSELH